MIREGSTDVVAASSKTDFGALGRSSNVSMSETPGKVAQKSNRVLQKLGIRTSFLAVREES